jgi:putative aldouronate transport system permease protein
MSQIYETKSDRSFSKILTIFLLFVAFICMYPIINTVSMSISSGFMADRNKVFFLPREVNMDSWKFILADISLWRSMVNNIYVTVVGTILSLLVSSLFAYPLANPKLDKRVAGTINFLIVFTMVFRYPLIPYFISVKSYGLMDTHWALILPSVIVAYNLIILRTFFKQMPPSIEESAHIEGAGHFRILVQIILPLSKPALATIGLFYAVMYWNMFFHTILFIRSDELLTLQPKLRMLLDVVLNEDSNMQTIVKYSPQTIQAATIMFATIPILAVYPFLQKHFVKGALLGSVKG